MPAGGTSQQLAQSNRQRASQGPAGVQRVQQATRSYPHMPARPSPPARMRPVLTHAQLRRLSPTLDALHNLTRHEVLNTAGQSDAALSHVLGHLSNPTFVQPKTNADEKKLRLDVRREMGVKQPATLAKSGRQIQTSGEVAKALGGQQAPGPSSRGTDGLTDQGRAIQTQKHVLNHLLQKPGKSEADVRTIGALLQEYHPKTYRNIQASYEIQQQRKSGTFGTGTVPKTNLQRRRYLKQTEQTQQARSTNLAAEQGKITHPNMPHGLVAFLGDLIPDTPAEIAAAAAGGFLLKGAGGALIRAGVGAAGRAGADAAANLGGKVAGKIAAGADRAILGTAVRSPTADRALYGAARAGERAAPQLRRGASVARTAAKPITAPLGYAGRHPGQSALGVNIGPGVVATARSGNPKDLLAAPKGYYQAFTQNPGKVAGTSARAIEGFLAAPVGIATNVGISAGRAASEAAHIAHIPGAAGYSAKQITDPTVQQGKDIADFGIGMAKTFASGDPNKIQKAIEDQYGVTPLAMFGIPGVHLLRRAGVPDAVGSALRKTPVIRKAMEAKDASMVKLKGTRVGSLKGNRAKRYETAQGVDRHQRVAVSEVAGRTGKNEVAGLNTIVQALHNSENRRGRGKNPKMTDEHLVKSIAETGMNDRTGQGRAQIEQYYKTFGQRHPDAPVHSRTPADSAAQLMSDPGRLHDAQLMKGADHVREMQRSSGIETSQRAKYMKQAIMYGIDLPEDRFLKAGRDLNVEHALAGKVDQALADALYHSDTTGIDFTTALEQVSKERSLNLDLMKQVDKKATDAFVVDMKKLAAEKGLDEPAWTHDSNVLDRSGNDVPGNVRGYMGRTSYNRSHRSYGVLQRKGLADQSFEALAQGSLSRPYFNRATNLSTNTFLTKEGKPLGPKGERILTAQQVQGGIANGAIDLNKEMVLGSQNIKSAILDPHLPTMKAGSFMDMVEQQSKQSLADEMSRLYALKKKGVAGTKGPTYAVVDRVKGNEFVKQHQIQATIPAKLQRAASRAILGYSPGWLLAQPVAEGSQGLAAVGLINQIRGSRLYKDKSPREQVAFDTIFGTVPGTSGIPKSMLEMRSVEQADPSGFFAGNVAALRTTAPGRLAYDIATGKGASKIDRSKALWIRRHVATGQLSREFWKMTHGLGNMMGEADRMKAMGITTESQMMDHFTKDPVARAKLEGYVDDVMGNWTTLTARERKLSAAILFYPYIRMSLQWAFHGFPARHPYKAAIQHFLAQENANKIHELMGNQAPSLFQQWASAPLYTGKGGKAESLLPLWRVVPGANTVTETLGEGNNPILGAAQALNPAAAIAGTSFAGVDPLSGLRYGGTQLPSPGMMARLAGAQILNLPAPLRFADAMFANGGITRAIQGKRYSEAAQLFAKAVESKQTRGERSFLMPYLPQNVSHQALAAHISRLLTDKYGSDKTKASIATGQLNALFAKYGIHASSFGSGSSSSGGLGSGSLGGSSLGSGGL